MRIGINTGGGDAPGLSAVIHAVVLAAHRLGWEVLGIQTGYAGLIDPSKTVRLVPAHVESIVLSGRHDSRDHQPRGPVPAAGQGAGR